MKFNKIIDNFMNIDVIIKYYDKFLLLLCVLLGPLKFFRILCSMEKKALSARRKSKWL